MATEVVIKSTPFNSVESGGKYDRPVFAQDFADFFNVVAGHGIVVSEGSFDSPEMKPTIGGDSRSVSVATGYAVLGGRLAEIEQTTQIDAEIGGVKDRYDRLVLEMSDDLENRNTKLKLLKGVEGAGKPPDIVQEKNFFQLSLCKWKQSAGSALISEFVDERKDRSVCGFFYPLSIVTEPMLNSYLLNPTKIIPERADLNDYKDFGCWLCTSEVAKTLKNCPITDGGFALRVMRGSGGNYRVQELITFSGLRAYRNYTGSSFSDWKFNLFTTDVSNVSDLPGKVYEVNFAEKSVPAKTSYTIASLTLPSGVYVISSDSSWGTDSNSTYIVARLLSQNKGELVANRGFMIGGGGLTPIVIFEVESQDTINFIVYWGSGGSSGSVIHRSGALRALRIR